jgi:hypothetical protein
MTPLTLDPLRVFIGYDEREAIAYHVLVHSIMKHASRPVAIIPLKRELLQHVHRRPRGPLDSTDFAITRFLVPYLSGYEGVSVFMDCDMLVRADLQKLIAECLCDRCGHPFGTHRRRTDWDGAPLDGFECCACAWARCDASPAVYVAKHDYTPKAAQKMDGQRQTAYPRKNWSSLMVFDNERCRALTPEYVNSAPGLDLHRFAWLRDEQIGSLALGWNWLVGEYPSCLATSILHYTLGGPWFPSCRGCDHAEDWLQAAAEAGIALPMAGTRPVAPGPTSAAVATAGASRG